MNILFKPSRSYSTHIDVIQQAVNWYENSDVNINNVPRNAYGYVKLVHRYGNLMDFLQVISNPAFTPRKLFGDSGLYVDLNLMSEFFNAIGQDNHNTVEACEEFCKSQEFMRHKRSPNKYQCRFLYDPKLIQLALHRYNSGVDVPRHYVPKPNLI
jgi:hypothetical protein